MAYDMIYQLEDDNDVYYTYTGFVLYSCNTSWSYFINLTNF